MRLITHLLISIAALVVLNFSAFAQTVWQPEPVASVTGTPGGPGYYNIGNQGVQVGDVNGDTFPDLLTFANYSATPGAAKTYSYVAFFSDATGQISPTPGVTFINPIADNTNLFATEWRVGDVNGDAIADVIVSARAEPLISGTDTVLNVGAVYIYYGANGISGVHQPDVRLGYPRDIIADSARYPGDAFPSFFFGWGLAVGDFNNDGTNDLVIAEHSGHTSIITDPSEAIDTVHALPDTSINYSFQYVYLGPITTSSTPAYTLTPHFHNANAGSYKFAVGDWNGDGITDLGIPAYGAEDVNVLGAGLAAAVDSADSAEATAYFNRTELYGKVLFYYGGSDISGWEDYPSYVMSKTDTNRGALSEGSQLFGYIYALAGNTTTGDYNGDGTDDFVTSTGFPNKGAYGYEPGVPLREVFFGGPNFGQGPEGGFGTTLDATTFASLLIFGYGTSGGDINGDGYDDYFYTGYVDSVGVDGNGARVNGQYYVYYGGTSVVDTGYVLLRQTDSEIALGAAAYGLQNVAKIWDVNGDGANDWAVGASAWGDSAEGKVYIYAGEVVTSVEKDPLGIAESYSLGQNYPNPFNPSTSIKFSLTKANHVVLKLYNILGKEVATLINENYSPGQYTYVFNTNEIGKQLASGTYFYRLTAGSFVSTKKMILLK